MAAVEEALGLAVHSEILPNLHHALYAAAWERRLAAGFEGRRLAGALPGPLDARLSTADAAQWVRAVAYYDDGLASRDLLFGYDMKCIGMAIATDQLDDPVVPARLRTELSSVLPIYREHYWRAHDAANRVWIADVLPVVERIGARVVGRLESLLMSTWPKGLRVDVVWVGKETGGYTSVDPDHTTISSGDGRATAGVEIFFHEAAHLMVGRFQAALDELWHPVQFYIVGMVVRDALREIGIDYEPYLDATGLLDRAWPQHRSRLETTWRRYVDGEITFAQACGD